MPEIFDVHEKKLKIDELFKKTPITKVNDQYVGLAWMEGEYKLHRHNVDEFFMVMEGHLTICAHDVLPGQKVYRRSLLCLADGGEPVISFSRKNKKGH